MKNYKLSKSTTLVNVGNSILKHFNAPIYHETYDPLDKILKKTNKTKICLVLFDACGKVIIDKYKAIIPFIYDNVYHVLNSVYPPTTVAATTSLITGKYPIETGYLGWTQYFKKYDDFINVFPSTSHTSDKSYESIQKTLLKTSYIWDDINKSNNEEIATSIFSFNYENKNSGDYLKDYFDATDQALNKYRFVYSYCTEPDHTMHNEGVNGEKTVEILERLNSELKKLVNKNLDTLFILLADHGMVDVSQIYLDNVSSFLIALDKPYLMIESRFASFFVKDKLQFEDFYRKNLRKYFDLKTKQEILENHTFGYGLPHPLFKDTIGDYFLIAKDKYMLNDGYGPKNMKANHAGGTYKERAIYMAIFNK